MNSCINQTHPPTPVTLVTSVTSGKITNFVEKNAIENVYFFFTYARCRRRLPSIKMINGAEELLILLSTAFGYEYLFWSVVVRVWIVRLFIRERFYLSKRQTTKRRRRPNQKYLARSQKKTEDNTLNAPCRKYVETMWYLIIFYTFLSISFSARAPPSGRAST